MNTHAVIGIDPGPKEHAAVMLSRGNATVIEADPLTIGAAIIACGADVCIFAFEQFAPYGSSLDDGSLRTIFETGRLVERLQVIPGLHCGMIFVGLRRQQVKRYLVGRAACGDPQVRGALIERFGPTKELAVGTKKAPGPLYGISGHHWAALAVAVTASDQIQIEEAKRLSWT